MAAKILRYMPKDDDEVLPEESYPIICALTCAFGMCTNANCDECDDGYPTDEKMCHVCDRECLFDGECHHLLTTAVNCDGFGFSE